MRGNFSRTDGSRNGAFPIPMRGNEDKWLVRRMTVRV